MADTPLALARPVQLETSRVDDRLVTTVRIGGKLVQATPALLQAVARLTLGAPMAPGDEGLLLEVGAIVRTPDPAEMPRSLHLVSGFEAALELAPGKLSSGAGDDKTVRPPNLDVSLFISPYRLWALLRLDTVVTGWWERASRPAPFEPEGFAAELQRGLEAVVREVWEGDLHVQSVLDLHNEPDGVRLAPLVPLSEPTACFQPARIALSAPGCRTVYLPTPAWEDVAVVSAMLGSLAQGSAGAVLKRLGAGRPIARQLVLELVAAELAVGGEPPLRPPLGTGTAVDLGRASLMFGLGERRVLVDPWIEGNVVTRVGVVDAVLLTRRELSRCPLDTLLVLDCDTPIYLPAASGSADLPDRMADVLRLLGFTSVTEVRAGYRLELGDCRCEAVASSEPEAVSWRIHTPEGTQLVLATDWAPLPPEAAAVPVDRVFCDPMQDRRPLLRRRGLPALVEPARDWFRPPPRRDVPAVLEGFAAALGGPEVILLDSAARYSDRPALDMHARRSGPALRALGPFAALDPAAVSRPGQTHPAPKEVL